MLIPPLMRVIISMSFSRIHRQKAHESRTCNNEKDERQYGKSILRLSRAVLSAVDLCSKLVETLETGNRSYLHHTIAASLMQLGTTALCKMHLEGQNRLFF